MENDIIIHNEGALASAPSCYITSIQSTNYHPKLTNTYSSIGVSAPFFRDNPFSTYV